MSCCLQHEQMDLRTGGRSVKQDLLTFSDDMANLLEGGAAQQCLSRFLFSCHKQLANNFSRSKSCLSSARSRRVVAQKSTTTAKPWTVPTIFCARCYTRQNQYPTIGSLTWQRAKEEFSWYTSIRPFAVLQAMWLGGIESTSAFHV